MENIDLSNGNGPCLETVKILHQTIVSLRKALEQSKSEILQLKQRAWPSESVQDCLSVLTVENHVLKSHLLTKQNVCCLGKEVLKKSIRNVATETNLNISNLDNSSIHNNKSLDPVKCTSINTNNNNQDPKLSNVLEINDVILTSKDFDKETSLIQKKLKEVTLKIDNTSRQTVKDLELSPKKSSARNPPRFEITDTSLEEKKSEVRPIDESPLVAVVIKEDDCKNLDIKYQTNKEIKETENVESEDIADQNNQEEKLNETNQEDFIKTEGIDEIGNKLLQENIDEGVENTLDCLSERREEKITLIIDNISPQKISTSLEDLTITKGPYNLKNKILTLSKTVNFSNIRDLKKTVKLHNKNFQFISLELIEKDMSEKTSNINENIKDETSSTLPKLTSPKNLECKSSTRPTLNEGKNILRKEDIMDEEKFDASSSKRNEKISSTKVEEIIKDNQALLRRSHAKSLPEDLQGHSKPNVITSSSLDQQESQELYLNELSSENQPLTFETVAESEQREHLDDESSNVCEDSVSTPTTIQERSIKISSAEDNTMNSDLFEKFESVQNISSTNNDLDQNEEVDDIELIFTTDETKESDFKEELVPIESNDSMHHLQCPIGGNDTDQNASFEMSDRELDDEVFNESGDGMKCSDCHPQMYNSKSDTSINQEERSLKSCYSCQDSSFENRSFDKEESFDQFNEKIQIVETDISKCGITDVDFAVSRRNTCPNPLPYRPMIHRDAVAKGLNIRKGRPIFGQSNVSRRDSGAQTDITALPSTFWRSESSLANKVKSGENFATLPSKLPLPCSRIKLSEKTVEARRVLLSDIGFTSMVPELSRSADHLGPETLQTPAPVHFGQYLRAPELYSPNLISQKFSWTNTTAVSPLEMSRSGSHSRYNSIYPLSPPIPSRRCSAPVSPSRRPYLKHTSRVRFANGSLPELRVDWNSTGDSGDSTDSLVDEAENFLRRSIDCLTNRRDYHRVKGSRRASAPEPCRDSIPLDWHPFLPRTPHDLRHEHWVKVIVPGEGKVRGGRVRYVGPVSGQTEQYVGVQLSTPDGHSDGVFLNRRYFSCEPHHAVFVPFKKVIMGWKP